MSIFEQAIKIVLEHEGGYTEDHAGATNYGVSLRFLRGEGLDLGDIDGDGDIDADDIRAMDKEDAIRIYRRAFWIRYKYDRILHRRVAIKVFDMCVNMGPRQAHRLLQRAARANEMPLKEDGIIGPISLKTINSISSGTVLTSLRSENAGFYRLLVEQKPEFEKYLNGWLNRAYS